MAGVIQSGLDVVVQLCHPAMGTKKVTISLRVEPELHAEWLRRAKGDGRSLSNWIRWKLGSDLPPAPAAAQAGKAAAGRKPRQ